MINIITPCTRPENLEIMSQSITNDMNWYIAFDLRKVALNPRFLDGLVSKGYYPYLVSGARSATGNSMTNFILDNVMMQNEDWVYILDDDNLLVPKFSATMQLWSLDFPAVEGFIFQQFCPSGIRQVDIRMGCIDQAQFIMKRGFIGTNRYNMDYDGDGAFITSMYAQYPEKFKIMDVPLCHYNRLKW